MACRVDRSSPIVCSWRSGIDIDAVRRADEGEFRVHVRLIQEVSAVPLFGPPDVRKLEAKGDVRGLVKALGYEKEAKVREAAAWALGDVRDPRAVEPLVAALKDSDYGVGHAAAKALVKIGALAVEPLVGALKETQSLVRSSAAEALGQIGDPRAVEPLIAALSDSSGFFVRRLAARALGEIGDPRAVAPLIASLNDEEDSVRQAAAQALSRLGHSAVEPLVAALADRDWNVRHAAAQALGGLGWKPGRTRIGPTYWAARGDWDKCVEIGAAAIEPLIGAFDATDYGVREQAARALGKIGAPAIGPLVAAINKEDSAARQAAVEALGQVGAAAFEPLVVALADRSEGVRHAAARALGEIGDSRAVEPLIAMLKNHNGDAAAWALGGIGDPRAVKHLIAALRDPDHEVREGAAWALGGIGDPRAVEPLIGALGDDYSAVREAVARALGQLGDPRSVEPLVTALRDKSVDVGRAAAMVLVAMYGSGKLDQAQKARVLAQRGFITERDYDEGAGEGRGGTYVGEDRSIGVDFPI
jgi:HEAT repeat protein